MRRTRTAALPALLVSILLGASILAQPADAQGVNEEFRLLRRITAGATRAEIAAAEAMGFQAYLDLQLTQYTTLADAEGDGATGGPDGVQEYFSTVYGRPRRVKNQSNSLESRANLRYARTWRWRYSDRQFYERMTWFWANHFNIDYVKRVGWYLFPYFDRVVSRKHTFGLFGRMLHASAGDDSSRATAMLLYLDNLDNNCTMPSDVAQENYSREFLELHGIGEGYREDDVRSLARVFTGLNIDLTQTNQDFGMLLFNPLNHCDEDKLFLGVTIPGDDLTQSEANTAIDITLNHLNPNGVKYSAVFIASKLVKAFLTDVAPITTLQQTAIDRAVNDAIAAYGPGGNITAMLQAILTQQNINDILTGPKPLYKYMSPWQFYACLLRASEADLDETNMAPVTGYLDGLAQEPYAFGPPIGYPEEIQVWVQDQPGRWRFAYDLFHNSISGATVDVPALFAQLGGYDLTTVGQDVDAILMGGNMDARDRLIVQLYAERMAAAGDSPNEIMENACTVGALSPSMSKY